MRTLGLTALSLFLLAALAAGGIAFAFFHYGRDLPDHTWLAAYEPPVATRVHAGDGRLLAEYAREKRLFVPLSAMPRRLVDAFLAAEDKTFYEHFGVDPISVASAVVKNLANLGEDRRPVGASTVTQQVAKNFLLSNELSFSRKMKEAILAMRLEEALGKDRILELYLNEIYLGGGSYGVAAAALDYFDRSLNELTLSEMAYLAALPKAPSRYDPARRYEAAVARRDRILARMVENGAIGDAEAHAAMLAPLLTRARAPESFVDAPYFAEEVRRHLHDRYGEAALYEGGLSVRTTLDPAMQAAAQRALRTGLVAYDTRHGWRGRIAGISLAGAWRERLAAVELPPIPDSWRAAAVLAAGPAGAEIGFADGGRGWIGLRGLAWARERRGETAPGSADAVLAPGDVVLVEPLTGPDRSHALRQIPEASGALLALDPHTGRVLAMVGGFDFAASEFNRATQAHRQPGSAFKPFVYLAALDHGYTPASIVLDAPFVLDQGAGLGKWKPENYTRRFYGPSTLRLGLEESRNLMTVRIAGALGMATVADYARRFGLHPDLPHLPAAALGAMETTPLALATAYAMLVNGGRRITPAFVERIQDRQGRTVYRRDERDCDSCRQGGWHARPPPVLSDRREAIADPRTAYQVVSMLEGAVQRGTGRALKGIGKPVGGKTGTTNEFRDAWFVGFTPDLVVAAYIGFDRPKSLGRRETGGEVAAPVVRMFLDEVLRGRPAVPFRVPAGLRFVRIDRVGGTPAGPQTAEAIVEAFLPGTEPARRHAQGGGKRRAGAPARETVPFDGLGGLY